MRKGIKGKKGKGKKGKKKQGKQTKTVLTIPTRQQQIHEDISSFDIVSAFEPEDRIEEWLSNDPQAFAQLPAELIQEIALETEPNGVLNLCQTNISLRKFLCDNEEFMALYFRKHFPGQKKLGRKTWKKAVLEETRFKTDAADYGFPIFDKLPTGFDSWGAYVKDQLWLEQQEDDDDWRHYSIGEWEDIMFGKLDDDSW